MELIVSKQVISHELQSGNFIIIHVCIADHPHFLTMWSHTLVGSVYILQNYIVGSPANMMDEYSARYHSINFEINDRFDT